MALYQSDEAHVLINSLVMNKAIISLESGGAGFYRKPKDSKNIGN
jgi:hypothetical protein